MGWITGNGNRRGRAGRQHTPHRSHVTALDWTSYPTIRFPDIPQIEIALIDRPDQPLMGAGEASLAPVGGALGNAIFDATGVRLTTVPFTPARVKAALDAKRAG